MEGAMPLADLSHIVNSGLQSSLSQTINSSTPLRTDVAQTEQWTLAHRGCYHQSHHWFMSCAQLQTGCPDFAGRPLGA